MQNLRLLFHSTVRGQHRLQRASGIQEVQWVPFNLQNYPLLVSGMPPLGHERAQHVALYFSLWLLLNQAHFYDIWFLCICSVWTHFVWNLLGQQNKRGVNINSCLLGRSIMFQTLLYLVTPKPQRTRSINDQSCPFWWILRNMISHWVLPSVE